MRRRIAAAVLPGLCLIYAHGLAQQPVPDYLAAGIARVESGDFRMGIMTLNEVVDPASKASARDVARAHAYRAQAYLGLDQPERARAAALLALKADQAIAISAPPFSPDLAKLFGDVRAPVPADPEAAAAAAAKSGNYQKAFLDYLSAYQALPNPAPAADDRRLRERIIEVVGRLQTKPAIPEEASAHFDKASQLLEAEAVLGASEAASNEAAAELQAAIRLAPWWPEATFKLAGVLQRLQRLDAALLNLNLYRMADPEGYAAATAPQPAVVAETRPAAEREAAASRPAIPSTQPALVYIYWPPQFAGGGRPEVYCDGNHIADLQNRRFIELYVSPGTHDIRFHKKTAPFSFEAGGKYYLRASAEGMFPQGTIRLVGADEGAREMHDEGVVSNDPRRTLTNQCNVPPPAAKKRD